MNTQTHILMGAVLFGRNLPKRAWYGVLGGFLPDLGSIAIFVGLSLSGQSMSKIFDELYFQDWWQITDALGHSFLLWGGLLGLALYRRKDHHIKFSEATDKWALAIIVSSSALIHSVIDLLVHRQDAHMHLWPLTRWKFISPVSYYDPAYFGLYFALFEAVLGLVMLGLLFRRYRQLGVRLALGLAGLAYMLVPLHFIMGMAK